MCVCVCLLDAWVVVCRESDCVYDMCSVVGVGVASLHLTDFPTRPGSAFGGKEVLAIKSPPPRAQRFGGGQGNHYQVALSDTQLQQLSRIRDGYGSAIMDLIWVILSLIICDLIHFKSAWLPPTACLPSCSCL